MHNLNTNPCITQIFPKQNINKSSVFYKKVLITKNALPLSIVIGYLIYKSVFH